MNRRTLLQSLATATSAIAASPAGHGGPLRRELKLRILNPDAPVHDTKTQGFEYPPSVVTVAGRRHVFGGSELTYAHTIAPELNILRNLDRIVASEKTHAIGGFDFELIKGVKPFNTPYEREKVYWRKTYCGAFDVHVLPPAQDGGEPWLISINHTENKNEMVRRKFGTLFLQNSVDLSLAATPETSAGSTPDGKYRDFEDAYYPFITTAYAPVNPETKWGVELHRHDMGPILWPRMGYLTADGKQRHPRLGHAHMHPGSLIAEDPRDGKTYIYVWTDCSPERDGAWNMVMAARAPLESRGVPGSFLNFYNGDFTEPSLPADRNVPLERLFTLPGGKASVIHPTAEGRINRFSVTRLKRSSLFLSVESYYLGEDPNRFMETAFRLSEDLRTWTDRFVLPGSRVHRSQSRSVNPPFLLSYPKFLSPDGASHAELDESQPFYVIASKPHTLLWREVRIEIG